MTVCPAGELVAAGLGCGTGEESVDGRSVVQGGKGDMGDEASDVRGDSEFVGEGAGIGGAGLVGVGTGAGAGLGLDCKLSRGMPEPDV